MLSFFSRYPTNKKYTYNTNLQDYIRRIERDVNHKYKNSLLGFNTNTNTNTNTDISSYNIVIPFISVICILLYNLKKA
jgi:hypothetical protein